MNFTTYFVALHSFSSKFIRKNINVLLAVRESHYVNERWRVIYHYLEGKTQKSLSQPVPKTFFTDNDSLRKAPSFHLTRDCAMVIDTRVKNMRCVSHGTLWLSGQSPKSARSSQQHFTTFIGWCGQDQSSSSTKERRTNTRWVWS
jgi:hypothetical protein